MAQNVFSQELMEVAHIYQTCKTQYLLKRTDMELIDIL